MGINLKEFIEKYQEEINNKEFDKVYNEAREYLDEEIGTLTKLFYKCGVEPLKYMSEVPVDYIYSSNIKAIDIPDNVTNIKDYAFWECDSLTSVTIGDNVKRIGDSAFEDCTSLTSVTIGRGMKIIGEDAFKNCILLKSLIIPDSVKKIGKGAIEGCSSLEIINYTGTKKQWDSIWITYPWNGKSAIKLIQCIDGSIKFHR